MASVSGSAAVTLVTQTRVLPNHSPEFARWQQHLRDAVGHFAGLIDQTDIPPAPPVQLDWVIVQHFESVETARSWLQSEERRKLLDEIQPLLVGSVDVHLFSGNEAHVPSAPVSMLVTTRVKPGQEDAFLRWQKQITAVQAKFEGFQGYKLEPPIAGVQDSWVMVVRFDSDAHLDAWLNSEQRKQLLDQATAFDEGTHVRKVQSGFESWFISKDGAGGPPPPAWKQNALVLLALYPVIFLFSAWVQTPQLEHRGMPFWLALFVGDVLSVPVLGYFLVPEANKLFKWWLSPSGPTLQWRNWAGAALVVLLYGAFLLVFSRFP